MTHGVTAVTYVLPSLRKPIEADDEEAFASSYKQLYEGFRLLLD